MLLPRLEHDAVARGADRSISHDQSPSASLSLALSLSLSLCKGGKEEEGEAWKVFCDRRRSFRLNIERDKVCKNSRRPRGHQSLNPCHVKCHFSLLHAERGIQGDPSGQALAFVDFYFTTSAVCPILLG